MGVGSLVRSRTLLEQLRLLQRYCEHLHETYDGEGSSFSIVTSLHRVSCCDCLTLQLARVAALTGVSWTGLT